MRFGRRAPANRVLRIEITSMIDVVFLLIIFFMTTARFAEDTRADLELPKEQGEQKEAAEEAGLIVNLTAEGAIIVSQRTLALGQLEDLVREEVARQRGRDPEQLRLMLRVDERCDSTRLNDVVDMLQRLGVGAARIATEVPR